MKTPTRFMSWLLITVAFVITISSCKKETIKNSSNNMDVAMINKLTTWLDKRKLADKFGEGVNIAKLQEQLVFADMTKERVSPGLQLLVIPINDKYKEQTTISSDALLTLVAFVNKTGEVEKANIVIYIPKEKEQLNRVPDNTFSNIITSAGNVPDGEYRMLSVGGPRLLQLEFKNGKFHSRTVVTTKVEQATVKTNSVKTNSTGCIYWYNIRTWDWGGGVETSEVTYTGIMTCPGCFNGIDFVPCRDSEGSSGGPDDFGYYGQKNLNVWPGIPGNDSTFAQGGLYLEGSWGFFTVADWVGSSSFKTPSGWSYAELGSHGFYRNGQNPRFAHGDFTGRMTGPTASYEFTTGRDYTYVQAFNP